MGLFRLGRGIGKIGDMMFDGKANTRDGLFALKVAKVTFNPSANTAQRPIGAYALGEALPMGAIVVGGFIQVNTTFTSAGADAGTIAISIEGANDIVSAIAISDGSNPWDAGKHAIIPKANTPESTSITTTTATRKITATVAVQNLTAGKATIMLYYVQGA